MSYIDLHMRSNYSEDGEFSPREIVELCKGKGLKYFAITDHNTIKGLAEAKEYCEDKDIIMIPGIELDCTIEGVNIHLLGC